MAFDRGPIQTFEITWQSGHVERVQAHQVTYHGGDSLFGRSQLPRRLDFHGEIDGRWLLQLSVLEDDLRTVRNVTAPELIVPDVPHPL